MVHSQVILTQTTASIQAETLELLEWPRLCQHVSTFAATKLGRVAAQRLPMAERPETSQVLLTQTQEVITLESQLANGLSFRGIHDLNEAIGRASVGGTLTGEELLQVATTLAGARALRRTIDAQEETPSLKELVANLRTFPDLEKQIHFCIEDNGKVADRASDKLGGIRERSRSLRDDIYQKLQRLIQNNPNAFQEQVITQRDGRFVVPVKAPQKDAVSGIVHDMSGSGSTLYIEPSRVVESNNRLRQLLRQEQIEEERIRQQLSAAVAEVQDGLEQLLYIVTTLDLATARARYSLWLGANQPRFIQRTAAPEQPMEEGQCPTECGEAIVLRQLRHPLLIWQMQHEDGQDVVPVDLHIQPRIRVVAITGPNTGGKTVTLKTLGLAVIMAKAGLFVPAREPVELPWFESVLADIGDEQSLQQSLSTFSGHIRRISRILTAIQPESESVALSVGLPQPANALVLLDEVGAGTDPSEGSALATALLKHLAIQATLTIATTHFGELKALKYQDDRFENASVEFDEASLAPTYRLLWGIPGRSNALTIAERLGLSTAIVAQAREWVSPTASAEVNQVIAGLEAQRQQQQTKAQESAQILARAEQLHREIAQKATALKAREQELRHQQEQAVQAAIAQAREEIAQVIRHLQAGPADAKAAQAATEAINEIAAAQLPQAPPKASKPKPGFRPQMGDRIRIVSLGKAAEVISAPDDKGDFNVRLGLLKMGVNLTDVESLQGEKAALPEPKPEVKPEPKPKAQPQAPAIRTSQNTIDLRGSRVADAEIELDRCLAVQAGPVWVIHGHGTGKLRRGVQAFLKQHPGVDRLEAAEPADGGTGATVVYLKA